MSEEKKETEQYRGYGFLANLHEEPSGVIIRIEWLEKLIKTSYSITAKRALLGAVGFAVPLVGAIFYLVVDGTKARFLLIPMLILLIALASWVLLYMFIEPSSGSLLSGSIRMANFLIGYIKDKLGRRSKFRNVGIEKIYRDGLIEFVNGDIGKMFYMDGKTSATAYPEEIKAQEKLSVRYHDARQRTTTEIKITSSQKQNADRQRANFAKEKAMNRGNKAIQDIVNQQDLFVKNAVEGKKTQIIQYLLIRDSSQRELEKHITRLKTFDKRGMYYSLISCTEREATDVLKNLLSLK